MAKSYTKMSIDELVEKYRQGAITTGDTSPKEANKGAKQLHNCYKILRESQEGRDALISLMEDPEPHVRCWVAAHCLQWKPDVARRVLEELRDSSQLVWWLSSEAKTILQEHDVGRLKFDH